MPRGRRSRERRDARLTGSGFARDPLRRRRLPCLRQAPAKLCTDTSGSSAVEFALVSLPFIMLLLGVLQLAIVFMTQSALDAGVVQAGEQLTNKYYAATAPTAMTPATLKSLVVTKAGGLVRNDATLSVELRQLSAMGTVAPVGNTVDTSGPRDILMLRAKASVASVVPLIGTLSVQSSVIVRRQSL